MGLSYEIDEIDEGYVLVWGDLPLDEMLKILERYKKKGFNWVWTGSDNSTICIAKRNLE